jgi:hydrophobe/amphiphile efflux-1 (HAE1) family protein
MHISRPFIERPVATSLLSAAILLAGGAAYFFLPVAPLPQVDFPTIQVRGRLPGASPETMASTVATPLERSFGRIAGVTEMTSTSQLGATNITLQLDLDRDIDAAARDVQAAINAAAGELPTNLPTLPTYRKSNPAEAPVLILALTSDTVPAGQMYDLADSILAQKISQVNGVGQVFIGGGATPAVRVDLNPLALAHYQIGLAQVRLALRSANANSPKGMVEDGHNRWIISATDQLFKAQQYLPLVIAYKNGAPVRLRDVAKVTDGTVDSRNGAYVDGKRGIMMIVFRQPGANIMETVDGVKALIPELRAVLPPTVDFKEVSDRSRTIRASVQNIQFTLMLTVGLVIMVIFLFLRNVWATVIPSVSVPLSLVGTFGVMYLFGYSIDNLSLMALAIVTGFVVDDAIVVIENIARYLEAGESPMQAALKGSKEIGPTVLSMSTSLISVFIPILLMGGVIGRLFREFAVTMSIAIAVSLVVSLTATPAMCARFLRSPKEMKHGRAYMLGENIFDSMHGGYARGLRWVLSHQPLMLGVTIAAVCLNVYLFVIAPKGFFPQQDSGRLNGAIVGAQDISFPAMMKKLLQFQDILREDPAVEHVSSFVGGGAENVGRVLIELKDLKVRKVGASAVIARLRRKLAAVPGAALYLQAYQDIRVGGHFTSSQYQFTLEGETLEDLRTWAPRIEARLRTLPGLRDVTSDQQDQGLQAALVFDRATAGRLGIQPQQIDETLYDAFGQRQVSTIYTQLNQYHVVMEVDPAYQDSPDAVKNLYVRSPTGAEVPLSAISHFEQKTTALAVNHQGQFPAITISFNLDPSVALGDAVQEIEVAALQMGMPASIHPSFSGTAEAFQESVRNEPYLILAALMTVYIVLGMLYESYIHPITILSTLPSAGIGALLALRITHTDLSVIAMIGIILLIGIVQKNAIMMIDFALDAQRKAGKKPIEAIYQACLLRFRPIMMTTTAALLGGLPLALETGMGSELRRPLGISIVGGLMVSQVLTLFTAPVVYLYMDRLQQKLARRKALAHHPAATPSLDDGTHS